MRDEYDIDSLNPRRNPYAKILNESKTITLDDDVIEYFKGMSTEQNIPYKTLIKLYLTDCMNNHRKLTMSWNN